MEDDHQFYFLSPSPTTEESFSSYSPFAQKSDAAFIDCKQFKLLDVQPIISDELLMQLSTRELNRKLAGYDRTFVSAMKRKRRMLKNRGYALSCRARRQVCQRELEAENAELREKLTYQTRRCMALQNEVNRLVQSPHPNTKENHFINEHDIHFVHRPEMSHLIAASTATKKKGVEYAQQNRVLNSDEDTYDWFRSPHSQSLAEPYGFCLEHKLPSTSPLKSGYEPITCCNFQQQLMLQEFAAQQQGNVSSTHSLRAGIVKRATKGHGGVI